MRDLLVLCPELPPNPALRFAASLAQQCQTAISGLCVCEPAPESRNHVLPAAAEIAAALVQEQLARARRCGPEFARWALHAGLARQNWLVAQGSVSEAVAHAANWHDLLIVERNERHAWGTLDVLGQLLLNCDIPLLLLPKDHAPPARLERIAVAWNGAPEATRALHRALPLLLRARSVLLLSGQRPPPLSSMSEVPAFDPQSWLEGHGVPVSLCPLEQPHAHDGLELLDCAERLRVDLLVMGASGRSRYSERTLGGATRHVLRQARMPVLLRH